MSKFIRFTDVTKLEQCDTEASITKWIEQTLAQTERPAAVCVYPSLIESAALALGDSGVAVASVAGAFPSGQTYIEVKLLEVAMAIENGADEIDMVIDLGAITEGRFDLAQAEVRAVAEELDGDALLKVILETAVLKDEKVIREAANAAMMGGADFIKTSTGKSAAGGATPQAARVMCRAIKEYYALTGRKVGFKAAGGIKTDQEAEVYHNIVNEELGAEWLTPALFRLGRSSI